MPIGYMCDVCQEKTEDKCNRINIITYIYIMLNNKKVINAINLRLIQV